ncbi:MAG: hypothetical protein AAB403_16045 [Planctomycetota bacterium]
MSKRAAIRLSILVGAMAVASISVAWADDPPPPSMTFKLQDFPGNPAQLFGRAKPSDASPYEIVPENGVARWSVPVPGSGANPILTAVVPVKVVGPMNTPVSTKANIVMSLYAAAAPDKDHLIKYHPITDADISSKALDAFEKVSPANEPFPYKRLQQGAQLLSVYEAIPNMFDSFKARAARIMYEGAIELHRRTESEIVVFIPDRDIVATFAQHHPSARKSAWANREQMLWLVLRRIVEPAIISEDGWDKKLKACLALSRADSLGKLQYKTVSVGVTGVRVLTDEAAAAPSVDDCVKTVQGEMCPDVKARLNRVKYLFNTHSMRDEFKAAYSLMVVGSSPPKAADLVADAQVRYNKLCGKEDFADLYTGKAADAVRLPLPE